MNKIFINNLYTLRQASTVIGIFATAYSLFPLLGEKNVFKMLVCIGVGIISFVLAHYTNYKLQTTIANNRFVYILTSVYYFNLMLFGTYLCVVSTPDKLATIFLCFLICALLMFINPPIFNLCLTLIAIVIFTVTTIIIKTPENFIFDIINVIVTGVFSLYFGWEINKLRLGLEISTTLLEDERNKYFNQSTIDELTQLNNRRDFMQTFHRFLNNYRTSDTWLCVSIGDIDFFKNYNDHYGHPQGDECLRAVGKAFNQLKENMGVYTARVGGEEFAMLWFEKDASNVDKVVTCMTNLINGLKIPHEKSKVSDYVTMSMGVYIERCGASHDVQTLYDLADKALYIAKGSGRNCTVVTGREIEQYKINPSTDS
jgi:diguanylate cyclase (GGDEF)-like protein